MAKVWRSRYDGLLWRVGLAMISKSMCERPQGAILCILMRWMILREVGWMHG